jgi:diguanylate cyclase (GGDEF)-like protein
MLQATLMKWGHDPIVTPDGKSALRILSSADPPRLAILDWMMPGLQGVEVCRELRKRQKSDYIYVILLTGKDKTDDIIEGLDAGADDYMVKPFQPDELRIRVREGFRALDRLAGAHSATSQQGTTPSDLLGREAILVALKKELQQSIKSNTPLSAIMIRLDSYAALRDDFGQYIADLAGKEVANIVQSCMKQNDALGRYDSDKLLLILPGYQESQAVELAKRLQSRLESAVVSSNDTLLPVTACLGITWGSPSGRVQMEHIISITEKALKQAAGRGPNSLAILRMDSQLRGMGRQVAEPLPSMSRLDKELIVAARSGDLQRVKGLINSGARLDASDNKGNTALMEAAFFKYPAVVQLLVDEGADVTRHNNAGDSALIEAIRAGHADVAEVLFSRYSAAELREDLASLYRALVEASAYGKADVVKLVKTHLAAHGCIPLNKKKNTNP